MGIFSKSISAIGGLFGQKNFSINDLAKVFSWGAMSHAGVSVSPATAMRQATVYSCVKVISEDFAKLPCIAYRRLEKGKERDNEHVLYELLHNQPNSWQTAFDFFEMQQAMLLLRGNAISFVNWVSRDKVYEIIPLHPDKVTITQADDWSLKYVYNGSLGREEFTSKNIWHVRGLSLDGFTGISPIAYAREAIGLALAAESYGAKLFGQGLNNKGLFEHPKGLSDEAYKRLKEDLEAKAGLENSGKPLLLEEGLKWVSTSMTNDDAQFLETRKLQRDEICGIFRVPAHKVSNTERATFNNIEQLSIDYVTDAQMPWVRRWESSIRRDLLRGNDRKTHFIEFLMEALLRGDSQARAEFYNKMFRIGAFSTNDIREKENMNPVGAEGDVRYVDGNLMKLGRESIRTNRPGDKNDNTDPAAGGVSF
jgi:HK97 family phage portal protein